MAQITASEIKGYIADQLKGYDLNVAKVKYSTVAHEIEYPDGNTEKITLYQGVDSEKNPKKIFEADIPDKTGGESVEFETEDIDFDNDWDNGNKQTE